MQMPVPNMTAACLIPVSATYRNTQLMDSWLSYFSFRRHTVFGEPVITVLYWHSTLYLALTSTPMDLHDRALRPLHPRTNSTACTKPIIMSPLSERNLALLFCICFNCSIKYAYTTKNQRFGSRSNQFVAWINRFFGLL